MSNQMPVTHGRGPLLLGITWSEAGLTLILIILRAKNASIRPREPGSLTGLWGILTRLRWDFLWVITAFIVAIGSQVCLTISVSYGLGQHMLLIPPANLVNVNMWGWFAQVSSILDLIFARIAVASFLLLLQERTKHWSRYPLYLVGAVQTVISILSVSFIFKQCTPVEKLWNPTLPGKCDGITASWARQIGYIHGGIGATCDFFLAGCPILIVRKIQHMKRSTKIGLCLVMGGGIIAGSAAIVKGITVRIITDTDDKTYEMANLSIWVFTEMWFIMIFGSIPTLRVFFMRFSHDIKSAISHRKDSEHRQDTGSGPGPWVQLDDLTPHSGDTGTTQATAVLTNASSDTEGGFETVCGHKPSDGSLGDRQILIETGTSIVSEKDRRDGNRGFI